MSVREIRTGNRRAAGRRSRRWAVRTTEEREAHWQAADAAAVSVWTAADGTPLYRVTARHAVNGDQNVLRVVYYNNIYSLPEPYLVLIIMYTYYVTYVTGEMKYIVEADWGGFGKLR